MRVFVVRCPGWDESEPFEPTVAAVEACAAGVEILHPGLLALPARGPAARGNGGEEAAAGRLADAVHSVCDVKCEVGAADSLFAAWLATRSGAIVAPGETASFLRDHGVACLGRPYLTAALHRLGVRTLGAFAGMPPADVAAALGVDAVSAHRLARGEEAVAAGPSVRRPNLAVEVGCNPPLSRSDTAEFAAEALSSQLHRLLDAHGLACTRLVVDAATAIAGRRSDFFGDGFSVSRTWRHDGALTRQATAERVRWQLDGWMLTGPSAGGGVSALRLIPAGLLPRAEVESIRPGPAWWGRREL
ncbi:MAG: hypothetical protein ACRDXX_10680 [Stackebrandtia sp.]